MSSIIVNTSEEAAAQVAALRTLTRLAHTAPSEAAALTDEDLDIFERQALSKGNEFMAYAHYAYMDYFVFFGGEMQRAMDKCRDYL